MLWQHLLLPEDNLIHLKAEAARAHLLQPSSLGVFSFLQAVPTVPQSRRAETCVCCPCIEWQQGRGWFLEQTSPFKKKGR